MRIATPSIHSGLPPGPKGTLLGGNVRQFRAGLLDFLLATARGYGPLSSFRIGPRRVFLVSAPELIEQVLVTDAKHYIKHFGQHVVGCGDRAAQKTSRNRAEHIPTGLRSLAATIPSDRREWLQYHPPKHDR
jgi:hypothetical protein